MVGAVCCAALFWLWYAAENYLGYNFKGRKLHPSATRLSIWVPVALTPATIVGFYVWYRREIAFLSRSTRVTGKVVEIGSLELEGLRDVTYSYRFQGQSFQKSRSVAASLLTDLAPGAKVELLVDQRHPNRSRLAGEP
jgi:hypothetical protein